MPRNSAWPTSLLVLTAEKNGRKLTKELIVHLAYLFFVWGLFLRVEYGGASTHSI